MSLNKPSHPLHFAIYSPYLFNIWPFRHEHSLLVRSSFDKWIAHYGYRAHSHDLELYYSLLRLCLIYANFKINYLTVRHGHLSPELFLKCSQQCYFRLWFLPLCDAGWEMTCVESFFWASFMLGSSSASYDLHHSPARRLLSSLLLILSH